MPPPRTGSDCVWGAQTRRVMPLGILQAIVTVRPDALASAMKRLHQEGLPASRDAGGAPLPKGPISGFEKVRLPCVCYRRYDLKICLNVQATNVLAAQRNDMVNVVPNAGLSCQPLSFTVELGDFLQISPFSGCFEFISLAA